MIMTNFTKEVATVTTDRDSSIVECHCLGLGHAQIARDFNLTRERVRQIVLRELGRSTPLKLQPAMRRIMAIKALNQLEVGESCKQIAQQWDLSGEQLERILREQVGLSRQTIEFQGWMAAQLGQQFGHWLVLAIEPHQSSSTSKMRSRVTARCGLCGTNHRLGYRNLANGTSTMCHRCSCKYRQQGSPVKDMLSGAIYPSLKDAARAHGLSYNQAQYGLRQPKQDRFTRVNPTGQAPLPVAQ